MSNPDTPKPFILHGKRVIQTMPPILVKTYAKDKEGKYTVPLSYVAETVRDA